jgi:glycosyltransferase involved in cell wall biosynthesis
VLIESADSRIWPYTLRRYLFNRRIARLDLSQFDAVIGFDLDGFLLPARAPNHIACVKGVIGDELQFERGFTRLALRIQANWEQRHIHRATYVITTSEYSAHRIHQLYGRANYVAVVPELIDLAGWQRAFASAGAHRPSETFRLLCVCRFYPRKNLELLLRTMAILNQSGRAFELHLVGGGGEERRLKKLASRLDLQRRVDFIGDLTEEQLAAEYRSADLFCFPSRQEGFGIVLLEAMAAGLPIVAAANAAIPEVLPHGKLVHENDPEMWAQTILELAANDMLRSQMATEGLRHVRRYDAKLIAGRFLEPVAEIGGRTQAAV